MADACVGRWTARPRRHRASCPLPRSDNTLSRDPGELHPTDRPRRVGRVGSNTKPVNEADLPASKDRIHRPVKPRRKFSGLLRHAADQSRSRLPPIVYPGGRQTPVWDWVRYPSPPFPCPCLRVLPRGKTDPCVRCVPRSPAGEKWLSTCPARVPASEFSERGGKQTPIKDVRQCSSRGEKSAIHLPYPCPCLRVFIRGGRQTPVSGGVRLGRPPSTGGPPKRLPPTRLQLLSSLPF